MKRFPKSDLNKKLRVLQTDLKKNPWDLTTRVNIARILRLLGREEAAINQYVHIAKLGVSLGDFGRALAACRTILLIRPDRPETAMLIAKFLAWNPQLLPKRVATPITEDELKRILSQKEEPLSSIPEHKAEPTEYSEEVWLDSDDLHMVTTDPELAQMSSSLDEIQVPDDASGDDIDDSDIMRITDPDIIREFDSGQVSFELSNKVPLFSELDMDSFVRLMQNATTHHFPSGHIIIREGDPADAFYIIIQGEVVVLKKDFRGVEVELARLAENSFFGEFALFSETKRRATIKTSTPVEVMKITRPVLKKILEEYPSIHRVLENFYRQRLIDNLLKTSSLFTSLSDARRHWLIDRFLPETVAANTTFYHEGEDIDGLYLIGRGEVEVVIDDDPPKLLARLQPGEFVGILSLVTQTPLQADMRTTRETYLLRLPRQDFDLLYKQNPEFAKAMNEASMSPKGAPDSIFHGKTGYYLSGEHSDE